ncbi:MAG TPA: hypothetical protein VIX18_02475 [Nitrospirota bacterium]
MKRMILTAGIIALLVTVSYGHPGKTNRHGGHKCIKGCEEWGLFYDEYHLHDKDGKPIRIGKSKKQKMPPAADLSTVETNTVAPEPIATEVTKTVVVTTYRHVTNVYEEDLFGSNPLIYVLVILLLLLLIIRMNRNKEREMKS